MTLPTPFIPVSTATTPAQRARCAHCGQPVPTGAVDPAAATQFCCPGCEAVYTTITGCGLSDYYRLRDAADREFAPATEAVRVDKRFEAFDSPTFESLYVQSLPDGLKSVDLALENVTCAACVWLVERLPGVVEGVAATRLSLRDATVQVTWDPARVSLSRIAGALNRFGYTPHPAKGLSRKALHRREERRRLIHLGLSGALMGNTMLLGLALYAGDFGGMDSTYRTFFRWLSLLLGMLALAWPGATFFRSALTALRLRRINLDVPIALALLVGGVAGVVNVVTGRGEVYFDSLTVLVFLLLVGRFFQFRQQRKADDAVELLFSMTPATCRVVCGDRVTEQPIEALEIGDVVEVRPGDIVPADGEVIEGRSCVNQSLLTGESAPAGVGVGDRVYGGSQNVQSILRVRVDATGAQTRVGRLMKLVERGVAEKPPIVQFADRVGAWFTLAVTIVSASTFAFWAWRGTTAEAIDHTVALLIVTCPCVLGLATPLTIAVAIGRLAKRNILVKSGVALERLAGRRGTGGAMLLDKTGTITTGTMTLPAWTGDSSIQPLVAELERRSNHPVARALVAALSPGDTLATFEAVEERGDAGIRARFFDGVTGRHGEIAVGSPAFAERLGIALSPPLRDAATAATEAAMTAVVVIVDGCAVAVATLGDRPRDDSAAAIAALRRMGWRPRILSGDAQSVVASVARKVGIDPADATGQVLPEQKLQIVRRQADDAASGAATVMIGDGGNDAAALAAADVGIAVHGGAEASLAAADIYIAAPGLTPVVELASAARKTLRVIRRNLAVSLSYNVLAGTLAATGVMTPLLAAILMPISSATVLSLAVASMSRIGRNNGARS